MPAPLLPPKTYLNLFSTVRPKNRSEGGAEPHPNGCILLARVPAARAGGVRRGLGADPDPAGEFSEGDGLAGPETRETAKSVKSVILIKIGETH